MAGAVGAGGSLGVSGSGQAGPGSELAAPQREPAKQRKIKQLEGPPVGRAFGARPVLPALLLLMVMIAQEGGATRFDHDHD